MTQLKIQEITILKLVALHNFVTNCALSIIGLFTGHFLYSITKYWIRSEWADLTPTIALMPILLSIHLYRYNKQTRKIK